MLTGIPVSQLLLLAMSQTLSNDLYTLPTTLTSSSFIIASFSYIPFDLIGQQVAAKRYKP